MKNPIAQVFKNTVPYHSAEDFRLVLPVGQQSNESNCKTKQKLDLKTADAFGKLLWESGQPISKRS